uniref:RxLR effector candidate protein n=2 Tax=Hyaloperonospora arabidopsidis (strain Emoy2) TaxID=559515 RepID=M4BIP0_HYAAE
MRPLSPFLKTLTILQWTSAGSTTANGGQTDVAAGTLSAGTPLPETSASVEPAGSQPQGLASGKTYNEFQEQEARFSWSSLPDSRKILGMDELFADVPLQLIESVKENNEKAGMIVTHDRLALWLHQFQTHGLSFHDDAPMESSMHSNQGGKLAVLFHGIRGITGMEEFAEAMQRKLLEEYPEAMPQVSESWRALGLRPDKAYVMMPILVEQIAAGANREKSEWPKALQMISHWLNYVDIYRSEGFNFSNIE